MQGFIINELGENKSPWPCKYCQDIVGASYSWEQSCLLKNTNPTENYWTSQFYIGVEAVLKFFKKGEFSNKKYLSLRLTEFCLKIRKLYNTDIGNR